VADSAFAVIHLTPHPLTAHNNCTDRITSSGDYLYERERKMDTTTPENIGINSARLKRIDTLMQGHIDAKRLPGALTLVARHGKVVHCGCYGMMDIESRKPVQINTIFSMASMTKPITNVAVMMLYEEGHFQLHEPVANFIRELRDLKVYVDDNERAELERPITIHHLLTHTAGFTYGWPGSTTPVEKMYEEANLHDRDTTLKQMIDKLAALPLVCQPGSAWVYGVAPDVLAYLVEVVSGMPFRTFLREKILEPLGMIDTDYFAPGEKLNRFMTLYGPGLSVFVKPGPDIWEATLPSLTPGGQGLVSTAPDYLRFCQMLLNGGQLDGVRLLGHKTVEFMTINHLPPELLPIQFSPMFLRGYGWGLGWAVLTDVAASATAGSAGEYGWYGACRTYFWIDPKEDIIGIVMSHLVDVIPEIPYNYYQYLRAVKPLVYQALED
jgi:CubicO group peptidase (beta-lactamase class C family)